MIAIGVRLGTGWGILLGLVALLFNFALGYAIASRFARGRVRSWLEKRGKAIPALTAGDENRWILLVRLTPGIPLFVQNYLLGTAGVGFLRYMILSLPTQGINAFLFISLGTSLGGSKLWGAVLALSGLIAAGILVSLVRRRLAQGRKNGETLKS